MYGTHQYVLLSNVQFLLANTLQSISQVLIFDEPNLYIETLQPTYFARFNHLRQNGVNTKEGFNQLAIEYITL